MRDIYAESPSNDDDNDNRKYVNLIKCYCLLHSAVGNSQFQSFNSTKFPIWLNMEEVYRLVSMFACIQLSSSTNDIFEKYKTKQVSRTHIARNRGNIYDFNGSRTFVSINKCNFESVKYLHRCNILGIYLLPLSHYW